MPIKTLGESLNALNGEHYWKIGKAGYPLQRVMDEMQNAGFEINKTYRVFEMPYHRFFVLAKGEAVRNE